MPSSLIKYVNERSSNGERLSWGRVDVDGLPFRGDPRQYLKEEEYEQSTVRVCDVHVEFFDLDKPEEKERYRDILDKTANGWFRLLFIERFINGTSRCYVEYGAYYLRDGKTRTPYMAQASTMELHPGDPRVPTNGHG